MFPTPTPDANVIRYRVFFRAQQASTPTENDGTSAPSHDAADHAFAASRRALYAAFFARETGDFIWHKHALHVRVAHAPSGTSTSVLRAYCLEGESSVGDAIDDEWVVTWLLFRLTTAFPDDDVLVQVTDTDGEFLLIECADVLPEWVSPENSADRVFVRHGVLHLVSVDIVPEADDPTLYTTTTKKKKTTTQRHRGDPLRVFHQSVRAVYEPTVATRASAAMQRVLQQKLTEAPRYMRTNRHRVRCLLPSKAAQVLTACPQLRGAAVEAFYYREPRDATAVCNRMKMFPPEDVVTTTVTLSRCQYAQLKQQHFFPPKPFLHLPGVEAMKANDDTRTASPATRAAEMGVKLACGLELLYASDECDQFATPWRQIIDATIARLVDGDASDVDLSVSIDNEAEDDDAWLYVHPDSLEEKLQSVATRTTPKDSDGGGDDGIGGAEELQNIAAMFNNFMGGISGVDGVESSEPVQLDMSAFMKLLNGDMAGGVTGGGIVDDDDEWDDPDDDDEDDEDDEQDGESSIDSDDELEAQPEDEEDRIMREAMAEMDAELAQSTLPKTFSRVHELPTEKTAGPRGDEGSEADEDKPLDLDFNLLSNLLESMASQEGLAGPVSNILSELSASR